MLVLFPGAWRARHSSGGPTMIRIESNDPVATPQEPNAETILSRLQALETSERRLRRVSIALAAGLAVSAGLAAMLAAGTNRSGELQATRFTLTDPAGVTRGTWAVLPEGGSSLSLQDHNGVARIRLTLLDEGFPGIALNDARGRSRTVLGLLPDGTATAAFADESGNTRTVLGVGADNASHLVFVDQEGQTRVSLGTASSGAPGFMLYEDVRAEASSGPGQESPGRDGPGH